MRRCDNCKFFGKAEPAHCRRVPPKVIDEVRSTFALVRPEWNCGEHKLSLWRLLFRRRKVEATPAAN